MNRFFIFLFSQHSINIDYHIYIYIILINAHIDLSWHVIYLWLLNILYIHFAFIKCCIWAKYTFIPRRQTTTFILLSDAMMGFHFATTAQNHSICTQVARIRHESCYVRTVFCATQTQGVYSSMLAQNNERNAHIENIYPERRANTNTSTSTPLTLTSLGVDSYLWLVATMAYGLPFAGMGHISNNLCPQFWQPAT